MAYDILFSFIVQAAPSRVFETISKPEGLNAWWPMASSGSPLLGATYEFDFGRGCVWAAQVIRCELASVLEWRMTRADTDWMETHIRFELLPEGGATRVEFAHAGWRAASQHYRVSAYCWAGYLRLLCRHIERGDVVPYAERSLVHDGQPEGSSSLS